MEGMLPVQIVAGLSAFGFGLSASAAMLRSGIRRRRIAMEDGPRSRRIIAHRLRHGISPLRPVAMRLLAIGKASEAVREMVELCRDNGFETDCNRLLSVLIAGIMLLMVAAGIIGGSVFAGLAVGACTVALGAIALGHIRDKRNEQLFEAIPGAVESMIACFSSGFTLMQTFNRLKQDVPGPLGKTFARASHVLELGGSVEEALDTIKGEQTVSELGFIAVALDVQHQSGGAVRHVLDSVAGSVRAQLDLRRSLRVQTAQAKLSARVVAMMPFVLVAAFSLISPGFLTPFFTHGVFGYLVLALAFLMQATGVVLVRRSLRVSEVS